MDRRTAEHLDREAPISAGSVRPADMPLPGEQSEEGDQRLFADRRCKELRVGRLNRDDGPLRKYCSLRADRESTDTASVGWGARDTSPRTSSARRT